MSSILELSTFSDLLSVIPNFLWATLPTDVGKINRTLMCQYTPDGASPFLYSLRKTPNRNIRKIILLIPHSLQGMGDLKLVHPSSRGLTLTKNITYLSLISSIDPNLEFFVDGLHLKSKQGYFQAVYAFTTFQQFTESNSFLEVKSAQLARLGPVSQQTIKGLMYIDSRCAFRVFHNVMDAT